MQNRILLLLIHLLLMFNLLSLELSLDKAQKIALERNLELLSAIENKKEVKCNKNVAYLSLIPSASISGTYMKYDSGIASGMPSDFYNESKKYGFSINQPIFNGGKIFLSSRIQSDLYKISFHNYNSKRLEVLSEVNNKFLNILEYKTLLDISNKSISAAKINLEMAETKFKIGIISNADLLNLKSKLASIESNHIRIENLVRIGLSDLKNYLQINDEIEIIEINRSSFDSIIEVVAAINEKSSEKIKRKLETYLINNNPVFKISELSLSIVKKTGWIAIGNLFPTITLTYSKYWNKTNISDKYTDQATFMLNASMPIFPIIDNFTKIKRTYHDIKKTTYNKLYSNNIMKLRVNSLFYNLIASVKSMKSSELAFKYANETYKLMQERFENNLISTSELLSAEIVKESSEHQYITSFYDFLKTKSSLMQQLAIENDEDLLNLIGNDQVTDEK